MDIIAAFATMVFGLIGIAWAFQVALDGVRDRVWNVRLGILCAIIAVGSVAFLGTSVCILISGPRLLPPFFT